MNPYYGEETEAKRASTHANEEKILCGSLFTKNRDLDLRLVRPFFEKAYSHSVDSSDDGFEYRIDQNCYYTLSLYLETIELAYKLGNIEQLSCGAMLSLASELSPRQRYRALKFVVDKNGIVGDVRVEDGFMHLTITEFIKRRVIRGATSYSPQEKETTLEKKNITRREESKAIRSKIVLGVLVSIACILAIAL